MNYQVEFPHFFEKKIFIKLDRIEISSNCVSVNEQKKKNKKAKPNIIQADDSSFSRVTRSKKNMATNMEWIRISDGVYKGDIAKVDYFDERNGFVHVKLFPRINFSQGSSENKRRPMMQRFDPELVKYV